MSVFFYICEYLGITPSDFFESDVQSPEKIRRITDNLSSLDEETLDCIALLVEKLAKQ